MSFGWLVLTGGYLFLLFSIARWGDQRGRIANVLTEHPLTYSLALGIYCTAWTFFGAVGQASSNLYMYLPILLGPILVYGFGFPLIAKMVQVSSNQHISTISDFIASRYGKRQPVALLITIIALLATVPYIALQLKAISSTFQAMVDGSGGQLVVIIATLFIALFAIYFGTQKVDVTEYRRGLILAIATESVIKLVALGTVAIVAYNQLTDSQVQAMMQQLSAPEQLDRLVSFPFWAQTLMAAAAVICLPRQFHVTVIDILKPSHLNTARAVFPTYLLITAGFIPVIALAGNQIFTNASISPDTYVMQFAIATNSLWVQALIFWGGLSAAIAMIIIATLTLSTMVTNDIVLPTMLANRDKPKAYTRTILDIRRLVIFSILLMAYFYFQQMTEQVSLATIGLIAFSLVIHLIPSIIAGLYWRKAHAHGVYAGLLAGLVTWAMWLFLASTNSINITDRSDAIAQGAVISLLFNCIAFVIFSLIARPKLIDRIQAQAFINPSNERSDLKLPQNTHAKIEDLFTLISTFTGPGRCKRLFKAYEQSHDVSLSNEQTPSSSFIEYCERALGGVIGASSANALVTSVIRGTKLDISEVVHFFENTTTALQNNMTALLTSLENIDQGISVIDKNFTLVAWNKKFSELFDIPKELLVVGTPVEKLLRLTIENDGLYEDELEDRIEKRLDFLRQGKVHKFTRQRADGKVIETQGNPLPGGGFVVSYYDITNYMEIQRALTESNVTLEERVKKRTEEVHAINAELRLEIERRKKAEQKLIRAREDAELANESKTRFLALASHDILQPLNAAKLYLSALQDHEFESEVSNIVDKLNHSVVASETLINTILEISRLDQGEFKAQIEPVAIKPILSNIVNEFEYKARHKELSLKLLAHDFWVLADKTYLFRILQNFVSNAVKYTKSGKVLVTARKVKGTALLEVRDTGIGIAKLQQAAIFSDYYRVENSEESGVGLGLGVVRRLSQKMNAEVYVQSELGKGSCFGIKLPTCAAVPKTESIIMQSSKVFDGLTALCIDDQPENLDAMMTVLSRWGIRVHIARNRTQALMMARDHDPQVLLVDYQLAQGDNGLDVIQAIRDDSNIVIPATLITANRTTELTERCKQEGVYYLPKPVKPGKLRVLLQNMTRRMK